MRHPKGHLSAWPSVRQSKLPLFLRQHLPLGDISLAAVEGRDGHHEGEDGSGHPECHPNMHRQREALPDFLRWTGQDLLDAVSHMAECINGSTYVESGNVAMGMYSIHISFCAVTQGVLLPKSSETMIH